MPASMAVSATPSWISFFVERAMHSLLVGCGTTTISRLQSVVRLSLDIAPALPLARAMRGRKQTFAVCAICSLAVVLEGSSALYGRYVRIDMKVAQAIYLIRGIFLF